MSALAKPAADPATDLAYPLLRTALNRFGRVPAELSPQEHAAARQQAAREYLVEGRVLASREAGEVTVPETVVADAVAGIRSRYGDHAEYLADLARNDLDPLSLHQAVARELRVEAVLEGVAAGAATVGDLDCQLFYWMHRERFLRPETRTVRHILITVNPDFPENERDAAHRRIKQVARRVQARPQRFAEQATKHSECPTAMHGGLLGRVPAGKLYPELDAALYAMAEGEVSGVIESETGFHVLRCDQVHPAGPAPYGEVADRIREQLQERRRRVCQQHWIRGLAGGS